MAAPGHSGPSASCGLEQSMDYAQKLWEMIRFQQFMLGQPRMVAWDELPETGKRVFDRAVEAFLEDLKTGRR